jgi:transposase
MSIVDAAVLFSLSADVSVEDVVIDDTTVTIQVRARAAEASCPACGGVSRRVHSRYRPAIRDPAVGARSAMIELRVRRFFGDVAACVKKTFVEQVTGLTTRYGRHSVAARRCYGLWHSLWAVEPGRA